MGDFITVEDVESLLQQTIPPEKLDYFNTVVEFVEQAIRNYTGQHLSFVANDNVFVDSQGSSRLFLPQIPIISVANVWQYDQLIDPGHYIADKAAGILHKSNGAWRRGKFVVNVEYSHGYINIPADIKMVAARSAARQYQAGLRSSANDGVLGVASKSLGDYAVSYGSENSADEGQLGVTSAVPLLRSEQQILNKYKNSQFYVFVQQW